MIFEILIVSGVLGSLAGYLSPFVTNRNLSYLGNGLSHAAFAGAALGLWLNLPPDPVLAAFTIAAGLIMTWLSEKGRLQLDTAMGIFYPMSMALGLLFLLLSQEYHSSALNYLFGSLFLLGATDYVLTGIVVVLVVATLPLWGQMAYATFHRELAVSDGGRVRLGDYILVFLITSFIVVGVKLAGVVLVSAFLTIPGATAGLLRGRFAVVTVRSVLIGASSAILGVLAAWQFDLPAGISIVLVQVFFFLLFFPFSGRAEMR